MWNEVSSGLLSVQFNWISDVEMTLVVRLVGGLKAVTQAENSDVLPVSSVAVAVMKSPKGILAASEIEKFTLPPASVDCVECPR